MKKRFVLPKRVSLPGGFVVRVQISPLTCDENSEFSYSSEGSALISIKKGLTQKQQRYYLAHELQHALVDYMHLLIQEGAEP